MKKGSCFRETVIFYTTILLAVCFTACKCSHVSTTVDTVIIANGSCKIDFQPGVKDKLLNPLNIVTDANSTFGGGFGPPISQGKTAQVVETYNFGFHSSWLSVRCAKPEKDGETLDDIWTGYNAKSIDPDGSIVTTAFGLCVVDYNWTEINSVPYGGPTAKHLHSFRIIAKSKLVNGVYLDSIILTIYANSSYPNSNDPEQLNITMTDTETIQVVEIVREIQKP